MLTLAIILAQKEDRRLTSGALPAAQFGSDVPGLLTGH